jgi:hypothetical protein
MYTVQSVFKNDFDHFAIKIYKNISKILYVKYIGFLSDPECFLQIRIRPGQKVQIRIHNTVCKKICRVENPRIVNTAWKESGSIQEAYNYVWASTWKVEHYSSGSSMMVF